MVLRTISCDRWFGQPYFCTCDNQDDSMAKLSKYLRRPSLLVLFFINLDTGLDGEHVSQYYNKVLHKILK